MAVRGTPEWQPSIALLREGDELEWEKVQRNYWRRVYFFIRRFIQSHQTCEDIVQDAFLGAAKGIGGYDPQYNFEQYLFGIAKNRLIDQLRRKIPVPISPQTNDDGPIRMLGLQDYLGESKTASRILRDEEDARRRRAAMGYVLKAYIRELLEQKEFLKLKIVESIFVGGEKNKNLREKFGLRDESAVAGHKFRAVTRMQEIARTQDPRHTLFPDLWRSKW